MSEYIQFTTAQVERAKQHLLCEYLQEVVDNGELNLLEAIEEQMQINTIFAKGREDMNNGKYQPVTPMTLDNIRKRSAEITMQ